MSTSSTLVLVVDDDEDVRDFVVLNLARVGIKALAVGDGESALAQFRARRPTAVLLDIVMPGLDGFQTLAHLRQLEGGRDIPVVFLTALGDASTTSRVLAAGADDLLNKPVSADELQTRVQMAIGLSRARTEITACHSVMRDQLTALDEARARRRLITNMLVHDMKSPLTVIKGGIQAALRETTLTPGISEPLNDAAEASDRLLSMVLNVLDIEVADEGQLSTTMEPIDLKPLLDSVARAMGHTAAIHEVVVSLTASVPDAVVNADRDLLRRVFANLLDNAIVNSGPKSTVKVVLEEVGGRYRVRVMDEGPGIPDASKTIIFDRFVRLSEGPRKTNYGLGLTLCKMACDAHGAKLWVTDHNPRGACFNVDFQPAG